MAEESIKDLKLRMIDRGFNRPAGGGCIVLGELDEELRRGLVDASRLDSSDWLHIFAPAAAVESVSVRTPGQEFSISTHNAAGAAAQIAGGPLLPALPVLPAAGSPSLVHLLVHKSARIAWRHTGNDMFELSISSPEDTDDLMRKVEDATGVSLRDGHHQLVYGTQVLDAGRPLASYGISKGAVLKLLPVEPPSCGDDSGALDTFPDGSPRLVSPLHELHAHWQRASAGLLEGQAPRLATAGTGGCYFLRDEEGNPVAVFKPEDEEPLAANNPKGRAAPPSPPVAAIGGAWPFAAAAPHSASSAAAGGEGAIVGGAAAAAMAAAPAVPSEGLRRGLRPGEGAVREVAAYVLDHGHFSGVPATAMVQLEVGGPSCDGRAPRAKVGSLQQYVQAESDCEERGVSCFPASEVHKIAVLDLRLGNTDRNGGNILARRGEGGEWELVPIDHGSCLPDKFDDLAFEWQWWPQADVPFDDTTKEYIASLDADKDVAMLAAHGLAIRPECLRVLRVCTLLLKKAAAAGLAPSQVAAVASRQALSASPLEKMHAVAAALATAPGPGGGGCTAFDEALYLQAIGRLMDELLEEFVLDNGGQLLL